MKIENALFRYIDFSSVGAHGNQIVVKCTLTETLAQLTGANRDIKREEARGRLGFMTFATHFS